MEQGIASCIPRNTDNELKFIASIYDDPERRFELEQHYLKDNKARSLYYAIDEVIALGLVPEVDIIFEFAKKRMSTITHEEVSNLLLRSYDFSNIGHIIQTIKDTYISTKLSEDLEELSIELLKKGELNRIKLHELSEKINEKSLKLESDGLTMNGDEMMNFYIEVLKKREEGNFYKSLGFGLLDKNITRPGAPGEMTGIVALKNIGKSMFVKCIENILINKKTCVLSCNLEMEQESSIDRLFGIREGIQVRDLLKKDKSVELKSRIKNAITRFRKLDNYEYFREPLLSIDELDKLIYTTKQKFKKSGVLPDDEYMLVVIDTIDLMSDFDDADPRKIKRNINRLHRIVRKHKCHLIMLLQANENKFRNGKMFKNPDDLDYYNVGFEDIEGGAAYAQRCRVIMSLNRPVQMKKHFFPEAMDEWNSEIDLINVNIIKQNDGPLAFMQFAFDETFSISPYVRSEEEFYDD